MKRYKNLSGESGVTAYEIGGDSIKVRFEDGALYVYTYASAGQVHVEAMKKLAVTGRGLSGYISQHVRQAYAAKLG